MEIEEERLSSMVAEVLRMSLLVQQWPAAVPALAAHLGIDRAGLLADVRSPWSFRAGSEESSKCEVARIETVRSRLY